MDPYQMHRQRQIQSLRTLPYQMVEIRPEAEYEIVFTINGAQVNLRIELGPRFPDQAPCISVEPRMAHRLVVNETRIACPDLEQWRPNKSLGDVVATVVTSLISSPPTFKDKPSNFSSSGMSRDGSSHRNGPRGSASDDQPEVSVPDIPDVTALLSKMTFEQLNAVASDEGDAVTRVIAETGYEKMLGESEKKFRQDVEQYARETIEMFEKRLDEARQQLCEAYDKLAAKQQEYDAHLEQRDEYNKRFSEDAILDALRVAASQSEESSDDVARSFVAGDMSPDDFLKQFLKERETYHERRIKIERLERTLNH